MKNTLKFKKTETGISFKTDMHLLQNLLQLLEALYYGFGKSRMAILVGQTLQPKLMPAYHLGKKRLTLKRNEATALLILLTEYPTLWPLLWDREAVILKEIVGELEKSLHN